MKRILLVIISVLFLFNISVKGEEVITSYTNGEEIYTLDDNFNIDIRDNVNVFKEVNGSGLYIGQNIKVDKNINGIGFLLASDIVINSKLENGLLIARNITLNGTIDRDLFVTTKKIKLTKDSKLNRDLFASADTITIEGSIMRDIFIGANKVIIKEGASIGGNARLGANNITIEDNVNVLGTLKYNDNANVNIKNKENFKIETYKGDLFNKSTERASGVLLFVYKVVSMSLVFALLYFLFPRFFKKAEKTNEQAINYLKSMGIGTIVLIITPLLALFLLVLPYTSIIGLISLVFYILFMYLSFILVGYLLGELLIDKILKKPLSPFVTGMFGILLIQTLALIPILRLVIILIGFGIIYTLIITQEKELIKEINNTKKVTTKKTTSKTKTK